MADGDDRTIPYSALVAADDGAARFTAADGLDAAVAGALLTRVVCDAAAKAAGASVEVISATIDVTGRAAAGDAVDFTAAIDRKTRTLVFANGDAKAAGRPLLTATIVFRIV